MIENHRILTLSAFRDEILSLEKPMQRAWQRYNDAGFFFLRIIVIDHLGHPLRDEGAIQRARDDFDRRRIDLEDACLKSQKTHPDLGAMSFALWVLRQ